MHCGIECELISVFDLGAFYRLTPTTHPFVQRIELIDIEQIAPHICSAGLVVERWDVDNRKIIEMFHAKLQQQQTGCIRQR